MCVSLLTCSHRRRRASISEFYISNESHIWMSHTYERVTYICDPHRWPQTCRYVSLCTPSSSCHFVVFKKCIYIWKETSYNKLFISSWIILLYSKSVDHTYGSLTTQTHTVAHIHIHRHTQTHTYTQVSFHIYIICTCLFTHTNTSLFTFTHLFWNVPSAQASLDQRVHVCSAVSAVYTHCIPRTHRHILTHTRT